jgi:hypothetical protein
MVNERCSVLGIEVQIKNDLQALACFFYALRFNNEMAFS